MSCAAVANERSCASLKLVGVEVVGAAGEAVASAGGVACAVVAGCGAGVCRSVAIEDAADCVVGAAEATALPSAVVPMLEQAASAIAATAAHNVDFSI